MRWERGWVYWSICGLACGMLTASVRAQTPLPPTGPAVVTCDQCGGPLRRGIDHTFRVLQDNMIGYPAEFVEPPLGFFVNEHRAVMVAKANPHRFTLYRSDFLDGTNRLSPTGAARFNLMASRLQTWPGPVIIEWSPDRPAVAESRRQAVIALLQTSGLAVVPERVVIGPSPYPGLIGTNAANNYDIMIDRDKRVPTSYLPTRSTPATMSTSPTGGGN